MQTASVVAEWLDSVLTWQAAWCFCFHRIYRIACSTLAGQLLHESLGRLTDVERAAAHLLVVERVEGLLGLPLVLVVDESVAALAQTRVIQR